MICSVYFYYNIFLLHNVCFLYSVVSAWCRIFGCFYTVVLFLHNDVSAPFFFFFFAYLVVFCKIGLASPILMLQGFYVMFSHTLSNKIYFFYI